MTFNQIVTGRFKNFNEGLRKAIEEAREENGHQDGYSGDIQTCDTPDISRNHPRYGTKAFWKWEDKQIQIMDKRECMMLEITGKKAMDLKNRNGYKGCKGIRSYYIFGWGAC